MSLECAFFVLDLQVEQLQQGIERCFLMINMTNAKISYCEVERPDQVSYLRCALKDLESQKAELFLERAGLLSAIAEIKRMEVAMGMLPELPPSKGGRL